MFRDRSTFGVVVVGLVLIVLVTVFVGIARDIAGDGTLRELASKIVDLIPQP